MIVRGPDVIAHGWRLPAPPRGPTRPGRWTLVPEALEGRGISPASETAAFALSLDIAEPWGGGVVAGRVERRRRSQTCRPVAVELTCTAEWLDVPRLLRPVPIWLEHELWHERFELGPLAEANWLPFRFELASRLPRAFEGRFVAIRWRLEARRYRSVGLARASLPLLVEEPRTEPVVRVETSPLGTWCLAASRSPAERELAAGPCSVHYEQPSVRTQP
jgi:hypothetical protein